METDEWIVIGAMIFVALVGVFLIKLSLSRITSGSLYVVLFAILLILGALGAILYGLYENKEPIWWIIPTGVIGFLVIFLVLFIVFGNKRVYPDIRDKVDGTVTTTDHDKISKLRVKTLEEGRLQRDEPEKRRYLRGYDLLGDLIGIKPPERKWVKGKIYGKPYLHVPLSPEKLSYLSEEKKQAEKPSRLSEEEKQEIRNAILDRLEKGQSTTYGNPEFKDRNTRFQYEELLRYVPGL